MINFTAEIEMCRDDFLLVPSRFTTEMKTKSHAGLILSNSSPNELALVIKFKYCDIDIGNESIRLLEDVDYFQHFSFP